MLRDGRDGPSPLLASATTSTSGVLAEEAEQLAPRLEPRRRRRGPAAAPPSSWIGLVRERQRRSHAAPALAVGDRRAAPRRRAARDARAMFDSPTPRVRHARRVGSQADAPYPTTWRTGRRCPAARRRTRRAPSCPVSTRGGAVLDERLQDELRDEAAPERRVDGVAHAQLLLKRLVHEVGSTSRVIWSSSGQRISCAREVRNVRSATARRAGSTIGVGDRHVLVLLANDEMVLSVLKRKCGWSCRRRLSSCASASLASSSAAASCCPCARARRQMNVVEDDGDREDRQVVGELHRIAVPHDPVVVGAEAERRGNSRCRLSAISDVWTREEAHRGDQERGDPAGPAPALEEIDGARDAEDERQEHERGVHAGGFLDEPLRERAAVAPREIVEIPVAQAQPAERRWRRGTRGSRSRAAAASRARPYHTQLPPGGSASGRRGVPSLKIRAPTASSTRALRSRKKLTPYALSSHRAGLEHAAHLVDRKVVADRHPLRRIHVDGLVLARGQLAAIVADGGDAAEEEERQVGRARRE